MATSKFNALFTVIILPVAAVFFFSWKQATVDASHQVFKEPERSKMESPLSITNNQYRPSYHFRPPKNWINGMFDLLSLSLDLSQTQLGFNVLFLLSMESNLAIYETAILSFINI